MTQHPTRRWTCRTIGILGALGLLLATVLANAWINGRATALPDAVDARMPCVSYAPFRRPGHTPFDPVLRVTPAQIEVDLRQLSSITSCVRTYGLDHGLDAVPGVARKLGMQVVLGAWIGRDPAANALQLEHALQLSREYADVVKLLVVGNEVLLRRELAPEALAVVLAEAKRRAAVPVAYADVWEFWLRNAAVLRPHVHVIAAHVLPYWEDEPVSAQDAVAHVHALAARLKTTFAPQPVFIAETGWPAEGRQRGPAVPGTAAQAQFARDMLVRQATDPIDFNWIEGFDQPWKRALEGAMGGYWGVFTAEGVQRVPMQGAVVPDPNAHRGPAGAALGAVGGLAWAAIVRSRRSLGWAAGAILVLSCSLLGALLVQQVQTFMHWNRSPAAWWWGGALCIAAALCSMSAAWRLARRFEGALHDPAFETARPGAAQVTRALTARPASAAAWASLKRSHCWLALSQLAVLFGAACILLGLIADARYRALNWPVLLAPTALLMLLAGAGDRMGGSGFRLDGQTSTGARPPREEAMLAWILVGASLALVALEGIRNMQAVGLALMGLALAAATLWPPHRVRPDSTLPAVSAVSSGVADDTSTSPASNTAGAPRSAL